VSIHRSFRDPSCVLLVSIGEGVPGGGAMSGSRPAFAANCSEFRKPAFRFYV
jgi:hypothetical protein